MVEMLAVSRVDLMVGKWVVLLADWLVAQWVAQWVEKRVDW